MDTTNILTNRIIDAILSGKFEAKEPSASVIASVERKEPESGKIFISPSLGEAPGCYDEAIKWIQKKKVDESQYVNFSSDLDVYPSDGAYALYEVLKKKFGWIEQGASWTVEPTMVEVQTDVNKFVQIPWGKMAVPGVNGEINTGAKRDKGIWKFTISGKVMKMHLALMNEIVELTKAYVRENSIYRGKNVRLEWKVDMGFFGRQESFDFPTFLPSTNLTPKDLILPADIHAEVDAGLFSLVKNSAKARAMGVPTKRLTILAGDFGTGKTLTAAIAGELCREEGRTFIYLADIHHLADAIRFSAQYAPALIFGEDIDTITEESEIDELSNTVDGVDTKNLDVMVVLTTNHLKTLPKKFMRPGRSDLIIEFRAPDAKAAGTLVLKYGGATLDESVTLEDAEHLGRDLEGMIPASIREVVERAKLFAIADKRERIIARDIQLAANGVRRQCELLNAKEEEMLPNGWYESGVLLVKRPDEKVGRLPALETVAAAVNHR